MIVYPAHEGSARVLDGSKHYPRDPDPEIRQKEAAGDNVLHMRRLLFEKRWSPGLDLLDSAQVGLNVSLETQEMTTCAAEMSLTFCDSLKRRLLK